MRAALTVLGLVAAIPAFAKDPLLVADPAAPLAETWTHQSFGTATEYKGIMFDGVAAIRDVYARYCAACHGANLEGQAKWETRLPNSRMPAPPHDASAHTWHHPDFPA